MCLNMGNYLDDLDNYQLTWEYKFQICHINKSGSSEQSLPINSTVANCFLRGLNTSGAEFSPCEHQATINT
jgi:hypothetical protein